MENFIKVENYRVWRVIKTGCFDRTTTNSNNEIVPKPVTKYEWDDFQKMKMNALANKILQCGLKPNEHNKITGCKSAKRIWDLLKVTHEGTNEVKRSKTVFMMSK